MIPALVAAAGMPDAGNHTQIQASFRSVTRSIGAPRSSELTGRWYQALSEGALVRFTPDQHVHEHIQPIYKDFPRYG